MLSRAAKIGYLRKTDLFRGVPKDQLEQVIRLMDEIRYAAGDVILREGEQGDALYLVVEGTASLIKEGIAILNLGPGACIGEMALLDDEPRSATIAAVTDVVVLRLRKEDFEGILSTSPPTMQGIHRILVQKLRTDLRTYVHTIRAQERVEQDIRRAREIQETMLPQSDLILEGMHITGACLPADTIGGDYYDHIALSDHRTGVFIGDVTGHGFYSGLIVAMAKSGLVTQLEVNQDVVAVLSAINRIVYQYGPDWLFMTAVFMWLDAKTNTLRYANAGHNAPFHHHRRTGALSRLDPTSYPLGIRPEIDTEAIELSWEAGDTIVLYSDGIVEAENEGHEQFGDQRLEACIHAAVPLSPSAMKQAIFDRVIAFTRGRPRQDDLTLVVARL
jgi:CRP-like cAMP-binding protein